MTAINKPFTPLKWQKTQLLNEKCSIPSTHPTYQANKIFIIKNDARKTGQLDLFSEKEMNSLVKTDNKVVVLTTDKPTYEVKPIQNSKGTFQSLRIK